MNTTEDFESIEFNQIIQRIQSGDADPRVVAFVQKIPKEYLPPTDLESPQARILDATRKLFAEKGFEGASTREIAERAGVNQAMIHYYFGNKKELYKRIIVQKIYTLFLMIASMMPLTITPRQFISEFPVRMIENLRSRPQFRQIMLREVAGGGATLQEIVNELGENGPRGFRKLMFSVFEQGKAEGTIQDLPLDTMMYFLLGFSYSAMFVESFFSIVAGIDFTDEEQWKIHRNALKKIMMHGLMTEEK